MATSDDGAARIRGGGACDMQTLAATVRRACVEAALAAYEEAGILGLCHDGRWEYALQAIEALDLDRLVAAITPAAADDVDPGASAKG